MIKFENAMPYNQLKNAGNPKGKTSYDAKQGMLSTAYEKINKSNYLIKELKRDRISDMINKFTYGENFTIEDIAKGTQNFLDTVGSIETIDFIPKTKVIVANNRDGIETLYLMTKKIIGQGFDNDIDLSKYDECDKKQLLSISNKLIDVYIKSYDKKTKKGLTIEFAKSNNYVKDKSGKLFLVDLSPVFSFEVHEFEEMIINFQRRLNIPKDEIKTNIMKIREDLALSDDQNIDPV